MAWLESIEDDEPVCSAIDGLEFFQYIDLEFVFGRPRADETFPDVAKHMATNCSYHMNEWGKLKLAALEEGQTED